MRDFGLALAWTAVVTATSDVAYPILPISVASLFRGICPRKFSVWVTHSTAVNLNATGGNHFITVTPVYETVG